MSDLTPEIVRFIMRNLRDEDRIELEAAYYDLDPDLWAERMMDLPGLKRYFPVGDRPAAILGATPIRPGVWSVYAFGTHDFESAALRLTRHIRRIMIPTLTNIGVHRGECDTIESHVKAHRWLEMIGMEREAEMIGYGRGCETFYRYRYIVSENYVRGA